jgi:hypothetical protein
MNPAYSPHQKGVDISYGAKTGASRALLNPCEHFIGEFIGFMARPALQIVDQPIA